MDKLSLRYCVYGMYDKPNADYEFLLMHDLNALPMFEAIQSYVHPLTSLLLKRDMLRSSSFLFPYERESWLYLRVFSPGRTSYDRRLFTCWNVVILDQRELERLNWEPWKLEPFLPKGIGPSSILWPESSMEEENPGVPRSIHAIDIPWENCEVSAPFDKKEHGEVKKAREKISDGWTIYQRYAPEKEELHKKRLGRLCKQQVGLPPEKRFAVGWALPPMGIPQTTKRQKAWTDIFKDYELFAIEVESSDFPARRTKFVEHFYAWEALSSTALLVTQPGARTKRSSVVEEQSVERAPSQPDVSPLFSGGHHSKSPDFGSGTSISGESKSKPPKIEVQEPVAAPQVTVPEQESVAPAHVRSSRLPWILLFLLVPVNILQIAFFRPSVPRQKIPRQDYLKTIRASLTTVFQKEAKGILQKYQKKMTFFQKSRQIISKCQVDSESKAAIRLLLRESKSLMEKVKKRRLPTKKKGTTERDAKLNTLRKQLQGLKKKLKKSRMRTLKVVGELEKLKQQTASLNKQQGQLAPRKNRDFTQIFLYLRKVNEKVGTLAEIKQQLMDITTLIGKKTLAKIFKEHVEKIGKDRGRQLDALKTNTLNKIQADLGSLKNFVGKKSLVLQLKEHRTNIKKDTKRLLNHLETRKLGSIENKVQAQNEKLKFLTKDTVQTIRLSLKESRTLLRKMKKADKGRRLEQAKMVKKWGKINLAISAAIGSIERTVLHLTSIEDKTKGTFTAVNRWNRKTKKRVADIARLTIENAKNALTAAYSKMSQLKLTSIAAELPELKSKLLGLKSTISTQCNVDKSQTIQGLNTKLKRWLCPLKKCFTKYYGGFMKGNSLKRCLRQTTCR